MSAKRLLCILLTVMLCMLAACSQGSPKAVASDLLTRAAACDAAAVGTLLGYDVASLTDIEMYTLSRMEYKIVSTEKLGSHRWDVTVDTRLYDIMSLLNEAALYLYTDAENAETASFDPQYWMLEQLNSNTAPRGTFRAVIPLIEENGVISVDTSRIEDTLRDAITGGAYSWYKVYEDTFGDAFGAATQPETETDTETQKTT